MQRTTARIIPAMRTIEGGGFEVSRPFPGPAADDFDPFLLLDEMAPHHVAPGDAVGAPAHPHRGFETVTYLLRGEVEHRDSAGHHGLIEPGGVQWMTAGDGIVHSEMPSERVQTEGGVGHGIQLWVNLPASHRRTRPAYQDLPAASLAPASGEGWSAEVIAGSLFGVDGPARTHTDVGVARLRLDAGAEVELTVVDGHTALLYAVAGSATVGADDAALEAQHLAHFDTGGTKIRVVAGADGPLDAMVLTGEPIGEPIVRYGPFVMNTEAEIHEAIADFNAGRMGRIPAAAEPGDHLTDTNTGALQ